jgi:malic enzyme
MAQTPETLAGFGTVRVFASLMVMFAITAGLCLWSRRRPCAECSPALSDPQGALLPPLEDIRGVSRRVALAVAAEAQRQGVAERAPAEASERLVDAKMWTPHYSRLRRRAG